MTSKWLGVVMLGVCCAAGAASADDARVEVVTEVVLASNKGDAIEPPSLASMKDEFARQNLRFTSFRLLQTQPVVLTRGKTSELRLPNGTTAKLRLVDLKDGKATIGVDLRKVESKITLGREGSVFVHGGKHPDGELVLVFRPAPSVRPRKGPPTPQELFRESVRLPQPPEPPAPNPPQPQR